MYDRSERIFLICLAAAITLAACGKNNTENNENNDTTPVDQDMCCTADMTSNNGGGDMGEDMSAPEDMPQDMTSEPDMPADETLRIAGLSAPVTIRLDAAGVLFIECATDEDCFAAQGYMHAKHRMFSMDLLRRQTRGKVAAGLGSLALDSDKAFRKIMTTRDGTPLEDAYAAELDDQTRSVLEAYATGVNAFLDDARAERKGAVLSSEYDFPLLSPEIEPWTVQDTIAVYMQLAYQLGETSDEDLFRTEAIETLGADAVSDIFTMRTGTTASVFESAGSNAPTSLKSPGVRRGISPERIQEFRRSKGAIQDARKTLADATSWVLGPPSQAQGSNNWVVGASRTTNGKPLLANDPHLTLNNPAIWYYVVLDAKTNGSGSIHVAGASIPAVPGIVVGHNGSVAWGTTTARLDMSDAYIETLNDDGTAVIFNGTEVPLVQKEYTFEVYRGQPVTEVFEWVPHHGPLISKDLANKRGISVRWVAHEAGDDLNFFVKLMLSQNAAEARTALQKIRTLNQSWVLADTAGEIAWYPHSYIPRRPFGSLETPNWLALPGDGSAEWDGFISGDDIPHVVDPASGYVTTANGDFDGSYTDGDPFNDGHTVWQFYPTQGFRMQRIMDLMDEFGDAHTVDSMLSIQADTMMLYGESLAPELLMTAQDLQDVLSDDAKTVVEALGNWNYTCPTGLDGSDPDMSPPSNQPLLANEAAGCAVFHVLLTNLAAEIFDDELDAIGEYDARANWYALQRAVHQIFTAPETMVNGEAYFDDVDTENEVEDRAAIVARALEESADELDSLFGSRDANDWRWGRIHTLALDSFFAMAGINDYNEGPWANDGGFETVDVAPPDRFGNFENYSHNYGASLRIVMELDAEDGISTHYQLPGGQVHLRDDPRYLSLVDDWLDNTARVLPYTLGDVEGEADETFVIEPLAE